MNNMSEDMRLVVVASVLFLIVSSPMVYRLVNSVTRMIGLRVADKAGCPNVTGLLVHTVVFGLLLCTAMKQLPMLA